MGNGILGLEASFDYYSWSTLSYSWKYIPIGVTANYHFKVSEPKIDPFVGLGLGYRIITCDFAGLGGNACSNSAIYFIGRAGARYFFSPKMAAYGDVGAGAATLNVGVMFKLN
jgi:outer membrane protein W